MAIGSAVQKGGLVVVYNEKGQRLFSTSAGNGPEDGLKGYTSSTVSIRRGPVVYTFNEKGQRVSSTSAR